MSDVNANIGVHIDTSQALAELKSLQRQLAQFYSSMSKSSAAAVNAQRNLQLNLLSNINASGQFATSIGTIKTSTEAFTSALEKNKFSMREYFRYAGGATQTFGKLFRNEFDTISRVAEDRVKRLQTQYIKIGRDSTGAMRAIAITPNTLNLKDYGTQAQIAAQRQALFNQLVKQGSTNLLNFGKNTQWAGRQLMVGFTLPLASLGVSAAKAFTDMETAAIKFRKVYGDLGTTPEESKQMLASIQELAKTYTAYGVAVKDTVALAADAAAAGYKGIDLEKQTAAATKLSVLGQIESQQALETTISLQNAFNISSQELASTIDFLNAVENQTVTSLDDITIAIPKAAPVVKQLGGDVRDLAFFLTAMKEGGINASEGANALKSGLSSLINPSKKASDMLGSVGISIRDIVDRNKGDLKQTVLEFARALDTLAPLDRARAIETMFGKFQFARISTLLQNITRDGTQAARVLDLSNASAEQLANLSEQELGVTAASAMNKFRSSVEKLRVALVPIGETLLQTVSPIIDFVGKVLDKFNNLSDGVKKAIVLLTVTIGGIGPIALMTFGLLANGFANIMKGVMVLRNGYLRLTGQSKNLGEQTQYLTTEQLDAASVAHSLDQSHAKLIQTFNVETGALNSLIAAYQRAIVAGEQFAFNNPGMMKPGAPRRKFASGGIVTGPGTGTSDSIAVMVSNGEAIVPAKQTKKYGSILRGIIADNIPGFARGRIPMFAEYGLRLQNKRENISHMASTTDAESVLAVLASRVGEAMGIPVTPSKVSAGKFDQIANEFQGITTKFVDNVNKDFTETFANIKNTDERFAMAWKNAGKTMEQEVNQISNDVQRGVVRKVFGIDEDVYSTIPTASRQPGGNIPQRARKGAFTKDKYGISSYTRISGGVKALFQRRTGATAEQIANLQLGHVLPPMYADISSLAADPKKSGAVNQAIKTMETQGRVVADRAIKATAIAAQVASPSKRTIAIGRDIADGLRVGMEQGSASVAQQGTALTDKAIRATQSRAALYGEGPIDPAQKSLRRQLEKQQRQVRIGDLAQSAAVSQQTLNIAKQNAATLSQSNARMAALNKAFMSGTFALTTFSGIASMAGGNLGKFADIIFQISGPIFALSSIIQMITGSKILEFIKNFKVGLGIGTLALGAAVIGYKLITSSMEKHRMQLEGLSDAMKSTAEQTKYLGEFFNTATRLSPYEIGQQNLEKDVTSQVRTQREQLKDDPRFAEIFKKNIKTLKTADDNRVKLALSSIALDYKMKGFAENDVQNIIDALREEAGRTDITLDVKSLKLDEANLKEMSSGLGVEVKNFQKEFDKSARVVTTKIVAYGRYVAVQNIKPYTEMSDKAKEYLNNLSTYISQTSKSAAGMFRYGLIDGKQFKSTIDTLMKSLDGLGTEARKVALVKIFTSMNENAKEFIGNITNAQTQMKILSLMSSGLLTGSAKKGAEDYNPILGALASKDAKSYQRGVSAINKEYEKMFGWMDKLAEQEKKGTTTISEDGGKSPLQQLKDKIKEMKEQSAVLKVLRDNNVEYATALEMANDATMRSLVLDAQKKGSLKGVIDLMNQLSSATNTWAKVQASTQTPEQKRLNYLDKLSAAVALNEKLIDIQSAPKIKAYNDQITAQEKALKGVNDQISKITKSQIDPIQAKIDANSFALEGIALKEDAINKKYDDQISALTKIETINQNIANLQKQRLSLSDAVTSGDISAAAQMVQDIRAQQTQDAITGIKDNLTNAKDQQIAALGRVELEKQNKELQYQISVIQKEQLGDLEKQKTQLEDNLQSLKDQLEQFKAQVEQSKETYKYAGLTREEIDNQKDLITLAKDAGIEYSKVLAGAAANAQAMANALLLSLQYQQAMSGITANDLSGGGSGGGGGIDITTKDPGTNTTKTGTITSTTSKTVTVKSGQTLSSIAKANNTTVSKILAANPKFTEQAKYNGGKTIFSGTTVKIPGKMYGGIVSGSGMIDSIPTMLTPGEFVMNRNSTRRFLPILKQMNESLYPGSFGSMSAPVVTTVNASNTQFDRTVYNYNLSVTANSANASADEIAQTVIAQIKRTDAQRIRSGRQ